MTKELCNNKKPEQSQRPTEAQLHRKLSEQEKKDLKRQLDQNSKKYEGALKYLADR